MKAGREMDALVAEKVLGIELIDRAYSDWPRDAATLEPTARYSTDIAAAWKVVEKLGYLSLHHVESMIEKDCRWAACLGPSLRDNAYAEAPTAPEAICRAALAAVGVELPA